MEGGDSIPNYLTKFTQSHDEPRSVGITVVEDDMVNLSLLGLPKSWHSYQDFINNQENMPNWEQLWSDLMQEEMRRNTRDGTSSKEVEDVFSLVNKAKKPKGKKSQGEEGGKKMDMMKVNCFHYHKHGHYAKNFPQKKACKKEPTIVAAGEALTSQFKIDFTLIACMANTVMGGMWYLDNGASFHMTGNRDIFSDFEEKDLKQIRIGMVTFQRNSGSPLRITYVMYVLGLKKNLVSIVVLEDRGYDVVFSKGKVFLIHITMGQVKQIDAQAKNLYSIEAQDACKDLRRKENFSDLVVERESKLPLNMQH